jgi:hypothetical protein
VAASLITVVYRLEPNRMLAGALIAIPYLNGTFAIWAKIGWHVHLSYHVSDSRARAGRAKGWRLQTSRFPCGVVLHPLSDLLTELTGETTRTP